MTERDYGDLSAEERLLAAIFGEKFQPKTSEEVEAAKLVGLEQRRKFLARELGSPLEEIPTDPVQVEELWHQYLERENQKLVDSFFEGLTPKEISVVSKLRGLDTGKPLSRRQLSRETGLTLKEIKRIEEEARAKVKANFERIDEELRKELKDNYDIDYPLFKDETSK